MAEQVIDASVAIKWYVPEPGSAQAAPILTSGVRLLAPDLIVAEIGNVLWRKIVRGELTPREAEQIADAFVSACPLEIVPSGGLVRSALSIAEQYGRSVYDSLYVALAVRENCQVVTADERLANALAATPLGRHVATISSL